ncbi:MAG: hypothetical protein GF383_04865 [Candidatus Lokiarchaeota archaeon]|nr:hypothetical protein [Candidatus Lokiarchaeota archaeon]MBD3339153.1 hypothetical protein [Candidatus Lokiarchaeota archaeon]
MSEKTEKIVWNKCTKCGKLQHDSHLRCIKCKNNEFEKITSKGTSKLLTYTILKVPPKEFRDKSSYAIGIVEFENGIKMLGQIIPKENLRTGMELKPEYQKICDNLDNKEVYGFVFTHKDK